MSKPGPQGLYRCTWRIYESSGRLRELELDLILRDEAVQLAQSGSERHQAGLAVHIKREFAKDYRLSPHAFLDWQRDEEFAIERLSNASREPMSLYSCAWGGHTIELVLGDEQVRRAARGAAASQARICAAAKGKLWTTKRISARFIQWEDMRVEWVSRVQPAA